jgi:hypothetical protein
MLSLTHAAREHVTALLSHEAAGMAVRISDSPEGIQFAIDRVRIGDKTFNTGDKCVLAIDQMVLRKISGQTLDVEDVDGQPTLVLLSQ